MADLTYIQQRQEVSITGQDSVGDQVNYVSADANGNLFVKDYADGPVTPGTAALTSNLAGGQYNSIVPAATNGQQVALQVDTRGALQITQLDGNRATYSATSTIGFASATNATDIFTITGSSTKTIRILRIIISATQTLGGIVNILLIKRSQANSGGTFTTAIAVPHDSTDSNATATVLNYTANPTTLGTAIGTISAIRTWIPTTFAIGEAPYLEFEFGNNPGKAVVLRGTSEVLAVNLNSTTITGGTWICKVEWTEE